MIERTVTLSADSIVVRLSSQYSSGHYADDDAALEQMLDSVVHELNHRRTEFSIAGCANLEEYVQTTGEELHRIVVILDETSMILDTTGRDKDGKAVWPQIRPSSCALRLPGTDPTSGR